jgi:hypothetical protein
MSWADWRDLFWRRRREEVVLVEGRWELVRHNMVYEISRIQFKLVIVNTELRLEQRPYLDKLN